MIRSPSMFSRLIVVVALATLGCAPTGQTLTASRSVPAAEGEVSTSVGPNGNTQVQLLVKHLAHPGRVADGATTYVAWLQASGQLWQNVGALTIDQDLAGRLQTTTPHRSFALLITAERFAEAATPTGVEVFRSTVKSP